MSIDRFPAGLEMDVSYPDFRVSLTLLSAARLRFQIKDGPFAQTETVDIHAVPLDAMSGSDHLASSPPRSR